MKNTTRLPRVYLQSRFLIKYLKIILILVLFFSIMVQPTFAQTSKEKEKIVSNIKKKVKLLTKDFKIEKGVLAVEYDHENNNVKYKASGVISMFGVSDVQLEATIGVNDKDIKIVSIFPSGVVNEINFGKKLPIQTWIPSIYNNVLDLKKLEFSYSKKKNYEGNIYLGQRDNKKYTFNKCELKETELVFTITKEKKFLRSKVTKSCKLTGIIDFSGIDFTLNAKAIEKSKNKIDWVISASRKLLEMKALVSALEEYNGVRFTDFPKSMTESSIKNAKFQFDSDKMITISGTTPVGDLESLIIFNKNKSNDVLVGYRPGKDYRLTDLNENLRYLDQFDLKNMAIVYAYSKDKSKEFPISIIKDIDFPSEKVKPGLILIGNYDMPSGIPLLSQIKTIVLRADIPSDKSKSVILAGMLKLNSIDLGVLEINEAFISSDLASKKMSIGMSAEGDIPEIGGGEDHLALSGETTIDKEKGGLDLVLTMEDGEKWDSPFGIHGISISNFGLEVGASGTDKVIGVRGDFVLGDLVTDLAGKFHSRDPSSSMVSAKFNELNMQTLYNSCLSTSVNKYLNILPIEALPMKIQDAELTIIPKPMKVAGKNYDPGLRIKGDGNIMGMTANLDVMASYDSGIKGSAKLDPIAIPASGSKIFDLGGYAFIDITTSGLTNPDHVIMTVNGKVNILGLSQETAIDLSRNYFYLVNEGKIFNAFNARFDAKGKDLHNPKDMEVRVAMEADLMNTLNNTGNSVVDGATKGKQEAFRAARKTLEEAKKAYKEGLKKIDDAQKLKDDALQGVEDAWDYVWSQLPNTLSETLPIEPYMEKFVSFGVPYPCGSFLNPKMCKEEIVTYRPAFRNYTFSIPIDKSRKKLDSEYCIYLFKANRCIPTPNFHNLMKVVNAANDLANAAIDELEKANDKINPLKLAFDAAQASLNELENATDIISLAAKWILDNATGVIDVKSAEFEGNLSSIESVSVTMKCNVMFVGEKFNVELPFSFSDPSSMAEEMADLLLQNNASTGWEDTFGEQLRGNPRTAYSEQTNELNLSKID